MHYRKYVVVVFHNVVFCRVFSIKSGLILLGVFVVVVISILLVLLVSWQVTKNVFCIQNYSWLRNDSLFNQNINKKPSNSVSDIVTIYYFGRWSEKCPVNGFIDNDLLLFSNNVTMSNEHMVNKPIEYNQLTRDDVK